MNKCVLTVVAISILSTSYIGTAIADPKVAIIELPVVTPLQPFHQYTCGDPTLPTAYYFFDTHYNFDIVHRMADVHLLDPENPRYKEIREQAIEWRKIGEEGKTCQEQIYLTLEQLATEGKISVGFEEGVHRGISMEEKNPIVRHARTNREVFQGYSLYDLIVIFKTGLTVFSAMHQFPTFGWESLTQEEYKVLSERIYKEDRDLWEWYKVHGADASYQNHLKALNAEFEKIRRQRSNAAYDNSLELAQQWMNEHPEAPRGYVVQIGSAHGNDIFERLNKEGHSNAVIYVCGDYKKEVLK